MRSRKGEGNGCPWFLNSLIRLTIFAIDIFGKIPTFEFAFSKWNKEETLSVHKLLLCPSQKNIVGTQITSLSLSEKKKCWKLLPHLKIYADANDFFLRPVILHYLHNVSLNDTEWCMLLKISKLLVQLRIYLIK